MGKTTVALSLALLALAVAGCGGKSDAEKQSESAGKTGRGTITCDGKALPGDPGLPAKFPVLPEVTFVKATDSGCPTPTGRIVPAAGV